MSSKNTILIMLAMGFIGVFILVGRWKCNKGNAPSTNYKPLYDSLLKEYVQLQKDATKRSDSFIIEIRKRDSADKAAFKVNRQSDERLKVKQAGVRKKVENLSNDSLINAIETFE